VGRPRLPPIFLICANSLCKKEFVFRDNRTHLTRAKEHYCSRSCQNTTHGQAGTQKHKIWERTAKRARLNGLPFSLTVHDIPDIPTLCPVLGILIVANVKAGPLDSIPSLDRLDPVRGYVAGNVRVISNRANRLRSDATSDELRRLAVDLEAIESMRSHQ